MALRAGGTLPVEALPIIRRNAAQLRATALSIRAKLSTSSVTVQEASEIYMAIRRSVEQLSALKVIPGLNEFASAQYNEPVDTVASIQAIEAKAAEIVQFFVLNAPAQIESLPFEQWANGNFLGAIYAPESPESVGLRALLLELAGLIEA